MKAILEFDLNDPDDNQFHLRCINSLDLALAIFHLQGILREEEIDIKRIKEIVYSIDVDELIS